MPNVYRLARPAAVAGATLLASLTAACASRGKSSTSTAPASVVQQSNTRIETSGGATYDVRTTTDDRAVDAVFTLSPDRLWGALPLVYDSLGIKLTAMNSPARTLGAQNARFRRRLAGQPISRSLTCGGGVTGEDNADTYDVFATVMTAVVASSPQDATMRTWVQGSARPTGTSGSTVRCASTGWLERQITQLVAQRVGSR